MAGVLGPDFSLEPRPSTETERRYLLDTDSVAPSESASMISYGGETDDDGDRTPRAHSPSSDSTQQQQHPAPARRDDDAFRIPAAGAAGATEHRRGTIATPSPRPQPYKGFPSEAHYLAALEAWADSKKFLEPEKTLKGFYGEKTMEEYARAPRMELGLRRKWRARKEARRESKGKIPAAGAEVTAGAGVAGEQSAGTREGRRNTVT